MIGQVIYKRTSTGAIQTWKQELGAEGVSYRTVSGQIDGAKTTSEWTKVTPKNVGRSNETSLIMQAKAEVEANYTKKLAQGGYHEKIQEIDEPTFFAPMLAKKYGEDRVPTSEEYRRGIGSVYAQPKLDGIRCIVRADMEEGSLRVRAWSRQGKPILSVPHILTTLIPLFMADPDLIFDGELYSHRLKDDFNTIVSLAKKQKPTAKDLEASELLIQYWIYDLPSSKVFAARLDQLETLLETLPTNPHIVPVPTTVALDSSELDQLYAQFLEQGYEGQMVRISDAPYEQKRSKSLLKRKEFEDSEFEILEIAEGIGNRSGMAGYARLRLSPGKEFKANIKGDRDFLRGLLRDATALVGTQATVEYFKPTPDGVPRFPRITKFHRGSREL